MAKAVTWTGAEEFRRKLQRLGSTVSKRIAAQAVNAGLNPIMRQIKAEINGTNEASANLKHAARQTIGKRLSREKGAVSPVPIAKTGFAVGAGGKKRVTNQMAKRNRRVFGQFLKKGGRSSASGEGVGISAQNVHWTVLGTGARFRRSGGATGQMPAIFKFVVPKAVRSSARAAFSVAKTKLRQVLLREATRKV
jgi:hypothetical protein